MLEQKNKLLAFYFKYSEEYEKKTILDMGMFLQKAGWISRQYKQFDLNFNTQIDALQMQQENFPAIYQIVYDNIYDDMKKIDIPYDVSFLFVIEDIFSAIFLKDMLFCALLHSKEVVVTGLVYHKIFSQELFMEISELTGKRKSSIEVDLGGESVYILGFDD